MAKSRTSLGTGSLSGRFIESLFRLKNPNQSLPMAQQHRQLGDVGGDALGRRPLAARPPRLRRRSASSRLRPFPYLSGHPSSTQSHYPPEPVYQVRRKIDRSVVQRLLSGLSAIMTVG